MDNITANITTIITVFIAIFVIKSITGLIFKLLFGAAIVIFIYYVYNGGSVEGITALPFNNVMM